MAAGARHTEARMIKGLHHNAYRCRNSAETRAFYEDFLGLPLIGALIKVADGDAGAAHLLQDGGRLLPRLLRGAGHGRSSSSGSTISTCTSRSRVDPASFEACCKRAGSRPRGARAGRSRIHPLDLFPRSERLCDRADRRYRNASRDDRPRALEARTRPWRSGSGKSAPDRPARCRSRTAFAAAPTRAGISAVTAGVTSPRP